MARRRQSPESGQALILVTVSLLAMCGLIGMVVDFGWSYFVRRTAQSAADAAAMAAVNSGMDAVLNNKATYSGLGSSSTPTPCTTSFSNNLRIACDYAQNNGFSAGQVKVSAGTTSPYPPGVYTSYWVTVQVSNTIPQLYSAVLGNPYATVAAKATAAIFYTPITSTVMTLNRAGDAQPVFSTPPPAGAKPDLVAGTGSKIFGNGVVIASNDDYSGYNQGNSVDCPLGFSMCTIPAKSRGKLQGSGGWGTASQQSQPDSPTFSDPFRGLGQPPLSSAPLTNQIGVPNGVLDASTVAACASGTCPPGVYYATTTSGGSTTPSGGPLTISANLKFAGSASTFGDYVFYGGLNITGGTIDFGPGRYVLAGALSSTPDLFYVASAATVTGGTASDAGRLFILTDPNYPGLQQIAAVPGLQTSNLAFGQSDIEPGSLSLYGLNTYSSTPLPTDFNQQSSTLADFAPAVIWQDQRFSYITYAGSGNVDISCGSIESPCTNATPPASPQLTLGGAQSRIGGVVYQPRGAWMKIPAGASVDSALPDINPAHSTGIMLVSGTLDVGAGASVATTGTRIPQTLKAHRIGLVE